MTACTNPRHDHYEPISALADFDMTWNPDEVTTVGGDEVVPMRCHDCGVPAHYDEETGRYHHNDATECFLAGPWVSSCELTEAAR